MVHVVFSNLPCSVSFLYNKMLVTTFYNEVIIRLWVVTYSVQKCYDQSSEVNTKGNTNSVPGNEKKLLRGCSVST